MNLLRKFLGFSIGTIIVTILGMISGPIITRLIGTTTMGHLAMFNTAYNLIIGFSLLGLNHAYIRYYSEEDIYKRNALLKRCLKLPLKATFLISIILLLLYKPLSLWIIKKQSLFIVILLIIYIFSGIFCTFSLLEVRMNQKTKIYSLLTVILKISYLVLVGIFFSIYNNNYLTVILSTVLANVVLVLSSIIIERDVWLKSSNGIEPSISKSTLFKYGTPFIFSQTVSVIFQSVDKICIDAITTSSEVGLYTGAITLLVPLTLIQGTFNTFFTPVSYDKYNENPENKEFFSLVNKIVSFSMLILTILLIAFKDFIILFLGPKFRGAVFILPFLVFMPVMNCVSETTVLGINFKKKTKNHVYISIIAAVFNTIGNIILIPIYGAKGAAISTGLSYVIFFIARTYFSNKYYKVNYHLKRFFISIFFIYILAIYSSFHKFDLTILLISIISLFIVTFLYRDVVCFLIKVLKLKLYKIKR